MYQEIITKVLTRVPIFADISKEAVARLASIARFNQHAEGTTIFSQGDPGDCLYIVASGKVEIFVKKGEGNPVKIKDLGAAEVFGEMALLDGLPRSATVKVAEKSILFYINRIDFNFFLMQNPEVALKIIETISRRLRDTNKMLMELTSDNQGLRVMLREAYGLTAGGEALETPGSRTE